MNKLPDISKISKNELLKLIPTEHVEAVLGQEVEWRVMQTQKELLAWDVSKYNHCVTTDIHQRNIGVPPELHPLYKFFRTHSERADFAKVVDYQHNQVAIEGISNNEICVLLHIAAVYPSAIHLGFIELANPYVTNSNPMDPVQHFAGIGNGVLAEIITNLKLFAKNLGLSRITGYAVDMLRAEIFCKRGFELDRKNDMFESAIKNNIQIPLVIILNE